MNPNPSPLFPKDHAFPCHAGPTCPQGVVEIDGCFFITGGHENFNSRANNGAGYATEGRARAAIRALHVDPNVQMAKEARANLLALGMADMEIDAALYHAWPDLTCLHCLARGAEPCLCLPAVA